MLRANSVIREAVRISRIEERKPPVKDKANLWSSLAVPLSLLRLTIYTIGRLGRDMVLREEG